MRFWESTDCPSPANEGGIYQSTKKKATLSAMKVVLATFSSERFVKTIKYECLNQFIVFGERHLWRLIKEFVDHYHAERFHQGLGGQLIRKQVGPTNDNGAAGKIVRRSRLGGMLNYYSREAA